MDTMPTIADDTRNTGAGRRDPDGDVAMANVCHTNGDYSDSATTTIVYEAHKESHMTSSSSTTTSNTHVNTNANANANANANTNKDVNNNMNTSHVNHGDVSHDMHTIQKQ
eukprot:scaffold171103_cov35-Attheya_sp.AAC.1